MSTYKNEFKIRKRFNELSKIFPESVDPLDSRTQVLLSCFNDFHGKRILDAGCGKGRFLKVLVEMGAEVIGLDFSDKLLAETKNISDSKFLLGSLTGLPFKDESFDFVFSIEVIEHIPNTENAIKEMIRVLKRGGKIIVIDKNKLSLHKKFIPWILIKKFMEINNKWMYPHDFPFREKWFFPWEINKIMKKYCRKTNIRYIQEDNRKLFMVFPFLNWLISWEGVK